MVEKGFGNVPKRIERLRFRLFRSNRRCCRSNRRGFLLLRCTLNTLCGLLFRRLDIRRPFRCPDIFGCTLLIIFSPAICFGDPRGGFGFEERPAFLLP